MEGMIQPGCRIRLDFERSHQLLLGGRLGWDQFAQRQTLSEKQVAALKRLLARYADQIPDYAAAAERLGLRPPRTEQKVEANCPECGTQLVQREGRAGPFYACPAPTCRYTNSTLPTESAE